MTTALHIHELPATKLTAVPTTKTPKTPSHLPTTPGLTDTPGSGAGTLWLCLFIGLACYVAAYFIDIRRHPYKQCPHCRNSPGRKRSGLFRAGFRACDYCAGTGRKLRLFAKEPYVQNTHRQHPRP